MPGRTRSSCASFAHPVVDIEVVASDAGGGEVDHRAVGALLWWRVRSTAHLVPCRDRTWAASRQDSSCSPAEDTFQLDHLGRSGRQEASKRCRETVAANQTAARSHASMADGCPRTTVHETAVPGAFWIGVSCLMARVRDLCTVRHVHGTFAA